MRLSSRMVGRNVSSVDWSNSFHRPFSSFLGARIVSTLAYTSIGQCPVIRGTHFQLANTLSGALSDSMCRL